jgi:acetaldehyde dehydrogenase/alcohol dehydrogenase
MAGMAFANAFLGIGHSLAHKLGAYHHLPHGICCALVISEVIRFNACDVPVKMGTFPQYEYPQAAAKYARIARYLGVKGDTDAELVNGLIDKIEELKETVGCKKTIAEYGISEEDFLATLDEMVENAFNDQCTGANPRYPLMSEIKELYLLAFYGKDTREAAKI